MDAEREMTSKLLSAKKDRNIEEIVETLSLQDKEQALIVAAKCGFHEVVKYLVDQGFIFHNADSCQKNMLHILLSSIRTTNVPDLLQYVVKIVNNGVDVNQLNEDKYTPIVRAAQNGLYDVVRYLLEQGVDLHHDNSYQDNFLHILFYCYDVCFIFVRRDLLQCVVKLIDAGVDVNQLNKDKVTPIIVAAWKGLYDVVAYMLEHGGNKHYVDSHQNNLLYTLISKYRYGYDNLLQCVVILVDAGVDVNHLNEDNVTPISIAASKGLYEVVIYLLEHGVDLHYVDSRQNNLMHILLYSYYSDLHYVDRRQNNLPLIPVYSYASNDNVGRRDLLLKCVVKLVNTGVDISQLNSDNEAPIVIAARKELYDVVIYLLQNGVDVHYVEGLELHILHHMLWRMYFYVKDEEQTLSLVNTLTNIGSNIKQSDYEGNTLLFCVGKCNHSADNHRFKLGKACAIQLKLKTGLSTHVRLKYKLINILLEAGCNANHQNEDGRTPLMHHIKHQADISILKLLIPHSDLSLTDNNGDSAISYCVQYHMINSTAVFQLLVDSSSDLMSRNNGVKLFHDILKSKRLEMFSYYIRLKLIINGVTAEGENMLHLLAAVNYDYSLNKFNWLLNNELDINHPCSKTNTPTMIAAFLLNIKYLELLIRHPRLDINAQNNQGHTALHLCIIGFTMFKDGLNKRQVNDVVTNYCKQIYPIYMACIDSLLGVDGIDVNIKDNRGRTSLMMAAMKNDRVLTRKLLHTGAIVTVLDNSGRSALQYLDIYQSVFDLTCFKLLLSNGNTSLLNLPCIDGNTIIQTALCFPFFWEPCRVVCFIRYLVAENCCLQILLSSSLESSYNQIDLIELSLQERDILRKLLYRSGAQGEQVMTSLNFDEREKRYEDNDKIHSRGREKFISFCSNVSLKTLCRRIIRQNLGLGIKEKVRDLELPRELNDFVLLKDVLHPQDYILDHIDDGRDDDDYDGYDIDTDRDDDYSQYNYQYFTLNMDHELIKDFLQTNIFPNDDDDDDSDDDSLGFVNDDDDYDDDLDFYDDYYGDKDWDD